VLRFPPGDLAGFGEVESDGRTLFAFGSADARAGKAVTLVYASSDGRHWYDADPGHDVFTRLTSITAVSRISGRLVIAGTVANNGGPLATFTPYFWRANG
jgi:hypothetical protein